MAAMRAAGAMQVTLDYYAVIPEWITGMGVLHAWHADPALA